MVDGLWIVGHNVGRLRRDGCCVGGMEQKLGVEEADIDIIALGDDGVIYIVAEYPVHRAKLKYPML